MFHMLRQNRLIARHNHGQAQRRSLSRFRPALEVLEQRVNPGGFTQNGNFVQVFDPVGVATDANGLVYVSHGNTGLAANFVVDQFATTGIDHLLNGGLRRELTVHGVLPVIPLGHLLPTSSPGVVYDLLPDGEIWLHDFTSGQSQPFINLKGLNVDTRAIYDIARQGVFPDMATLVLPNSDQTQYGDLAEFVGKDSVDFFFSGLTGLAGGGTPFVMRVRILGSPVRLEAKVILSTTATSTTSLPRGVAVNANGTVLTTMAVNADLNDRLIAFGDNFPETAAAPRVILPALRIPSHGMTTDATGDFYIATGAALSDFGGSGGIVELSSDFNNGTVYPSGSNVADSEDIAIGPSDLGPNNYVAYITVANLNAVYSLPVTGFSANAGPAITTQPTSQTVNSGATATFTAVATGTPLPTAQWQVSTNSGASFSNISGATSTVLTVNNVSGAMSGNEYRAVFTNVAGSATTNAVTLLVAAQVSGTVFQDYNTNGLQDPGEPGLAGQTVSLDLNGSVVQTATSDANGNYQFTVPTAGTYTVRQSLLGGVLLKAPASGSYQVTVTGGAIITGQNFADVLTSIAVPLTLPPSTPFPSQGNANADFVEAVYRAILQRDADPGGLSGWTGALNDHSKSRLQVVQGIRNSLEHFGQEVDAFYLTLLGRTADAQGRANWVAELQSGMREEQVAFDFLNSPEYLGKGDKYFVDSMYRSLLGRSFDSAGEQGWLSALGDDATGNPTHPATLTHQQVITDFLYSEESLRRLVEGYYEVYLQRHAEADGMNSWLAQLGQGLPFLTIGQGFVASDEFFNKAAAHG